MPDCAPNALDRLMPMHVLVNGDGRISRCGPTMHAIFAGDGPVGQAFWDRFTPTRRMRTLDLAALAAANSVVHLRAADPAGAQLRGIVVPACTVAGPGAAGVLINLSFGIHLAEAVRRYRLTVSDFAPTDLAMELLYLQEAKSAVLGELRGLTSRLDEARRSAEHQARTDPLTGLSNRRAFETALAEMAQAHEGGNGAGFAIAHIDLDHFKQVNDTHGHAAGDQVLVHVARMLAEGVRRTDLAARIGGDEFVLLLRGTADRGALRDFGDRLIARLEVPFTIDPGADATPIRVSISASIGIAIPEGGIPINPDRLMSLADAGLYAAKRRGRGRCVVRDAADGATARPG